MNSATPIHGPNEGREEKGSIGQLFKNFAVDAGELIKKEIELGRTEMTQKLSLKQQGMKSAVAGGVLLFFAAQLFLAMAVLALSMAVAPWAAALIVALVVGAVGYVLVNRGQHVMASSSLKPNATVESLKTDRNFVKEKWTDVRKHS